MKDLSAIISPPLEEKVSFRNELLRKGIHICSLSIPVLYCYLSRKLMLTLVIPVAAAFLIADLLRSFHQPSFELYKKIFGSMLRTHEKLKEKKTLNGASWVLLSATACILVFPRIITITAFAILIISDTMAALIGKRFGTKKYRGKTIQGSTAFVLSAFIVVLCTPKITYVFGEYLIAMVAGIFGAVAEVLSFNLIDDNFAIPVVIGFVLWLEYFLFFPALNLFVF
jgi:dolichol kinase